MERRVKQADRRGQALELGEDAGEVLALVWQELGQGGTAGGFLGGQDSRGLCRLILHLPDQLGRRYFQASAKAENCIHGRHAVTTLDEGYITNIQTGSLGKLLLRDGRTCAESGQHPTYNGLQIRMTACFQVGNPTGSVATLPLTIVREMLAPEDRRPYEPLREADGKKIDAYLILSKLPAMKRYPIALALLTGILPVAGQQSVPAWDVEIPPAIVVETPAKPAETSKPIEYEVLRSRTKDKFVSKAAEMLDLPQVEGTIKMTIQRVANPDLPDGPPPLPVLPPDDPAVLARLDELRENYLGTQLVFLSASVYLDDIRAPDARTLLRIYPNGDADEEVVAWSNVNFLHLTGQGGYRVNHSDGTHQDMILLMGISPLYGQNLRRLATEAGNKYEESNIPELPDLATAGPVFVVVEGYTDSPALDVLEQLHDLVKKSGHPLEEQYIAREKEKAERKAFLLANPPKPQDVTVRVWRRTPSKNSQKELR